MFATFFHTLLVSWQQKHFPEHDKKQSQATEGCNTINWEVSCYKEFSCSDKSRRYFINSATLYRKTYRNRCKGNLSGEFKWWGVQEHMWLAECSEIGDVHRWTVSLLQTGNRLPAPEFSDLNSTAWAAILAHILGGPARSGLYQDPELIPVYHFTLFVQQEFHQCLWSSKRRGLFGSVSENDLTFKWSHPEQSLIFGCSFFNENPEFHSSEQQLETEKPAVIFQESPGIKKKTEKHLLAG